MFIPINERKEITVDIKRIETRWIAGALYYDIFGKCGENIFATFSQVACIYNRHNTQNATCFLKNTITCETWETDVPFVALDAKQFVTFARA